MKILLVLIASQLVAQVRVTFSPNLTYQLPGKQIVWNVTACVASTAAPGANVRGGDLYAMLTAKGVTWLTQSQAVTALQAAPTKSWPARMVKYGGWLLAGGAVLLTTDQVKASAKWTAGITSGAAFVNVLVPLAQKAVPAVPTDVQSGLLGPFLVVPQGACSSAIVLGSNGSGFEGQIP